METHLWLVLTAAGSEGLLVAAVPCSGERETVLNSLMEILATFALVWWRGSVETHTPETVSYSYGLPAMLASSIAQMAHTVLEGNTGHLHHSDRHSVKLTLCLTHIHFQKKVL